MQRRSFLAGLVATAAGLLVPARLLEDDPKRVYSFVRRPRGKPTLRIYAGMQPLDADAAISRQTLLSEIELTASQFNAGEWHTRVAFDGHTGFARNAFGAPFHLHGVDAAANATGTASFGRLVDGYGETVMDLIGDELVLLDEHGKRTRCITTCGTVAANLELPGSLARGLI
jgi:hypothetical protein